LTAMPGRTCCQGRSSNSASNLLKRPIGRAHQVVNGRIAGPHLGQNGFAGNAPIMPHAGLCRIERHPRGENGVVDAA
jgi:hypothetical protein